MIPISDNLPSKRFPVVTRTLVVLNVLAFIFEALLGPNLKEFIFEFGVVPARYTSFDNITEEGIFGLVIPLFTCLFLHGGIIHLLGNMITLWIFGDNVEDRMGKLVFLLFYFGMGIAASVGQIISAPYSEIPVIGASGAIAGVMGFYFIMFPRATVVIAVPIFFFIDFWEVPAPVFFIFWFLLQFYSGVMGFIAGNQGVAWWAHIAGFVVGMLIAKLFYKKRNQQKRRRSSSS